MNVLPIQLPIQLLGESITLYPHRVALLHRCRTLLLADLHLGRQHAWRADGLPISRAAVEASLDEAVVRLDAIIKLTTPARVLILGDLLHAPSGLTPEMIDRVAAWRSTIPLPFELVPGNHDRRLHLVTQPWNLHIHAPVLIEPPFIFTHDANDCDLPQHASLPPKAILWCGHFHPVVNLFTRGDALRLPCFHFAPQHEADVADEPRHIRALLPAFSGMSTGATVKPRPGDRIFAVTPTEVIDVSASAPKPNVETPRSRQRL